MYVLLRLTSDAIPKKKKKREKMINQISFFYKDQHYKLLKGDSPQQNKKKPHRP